MTSLRAQRSTPFFFGRERARFFFNFIARSGLINTLGASGRLITTGLKHYLA
jgi:hypothetical protein